MEKNNIPNLSFSNSKFKKLNLGEVLSDLIDCEHKTAPYIDDSEYKIVRTADIRDGRLLRKNLLSTTKEAHKEWTVRGVPKYGEIIFTREAPAGESTLVPKDINIALGQRTVLLRPDEAQINGVYLSKYLQSPYAIKSINKFVIGSTVNRINMKDIPKVKVAFPLKEEQQKIADFLSSIDQKIQQLRQKKELLEEYKKGVMQKLFSQEIRFKDENGEDFPDWETKRLGKLGAFSKGKGIAKKDISEEGEYKCIRYGELYTAYNEMIDEINSKTNLPEDKLVFSKSNDVLIPSSGETHIDIATASCVLKNGIALGGDINIFRTNQNGVFISYYLKNAYKHQIANLAQGNSVIHLYSKQLKSLEISLPSIKEQNKIVDFLEKIDDKIQYIINKLSSTQTFKKGLLQQMFV